jgi:dTDP-4-amino-4,6-dideoxygalactose transaminase
VEEYATNNAHMFYIVCNSIEQRTALIKHLKNEEILAVFHYISLHSSSYYSDKHDGRELRNSDKFTNTLLRLPMYFELDVKVVVNKILKYD